MTAMTMSLAHERADAGLERLTFGLMLAFVAALQISIAVAQILLAATVLAWVTLLVRDKSRPAAPRFFLPLVIYGVATLISSYFSVDPRASLIDDKQLVLFAIVPAIYDIARGSRATTTIEVIISVGAASAAYGIIQYGMLHYDNLGRRPEGALTHYMTYSGILMLVICAAVARLVFGSRDRVWPALVMPALVVALALTFTRGAWVGAAVAVALLFVLKDVRLAALLPLVFGVMFFVAPDRVATRVTSMFSAQDPANQDRLAMVEIGARILMDHPLAGVGPNMVPRVYQQYRPDYAVNKTNPHLHNVPLQIAAERGLPALAAWLVFMGILALGLYRLFRRGGDQTLPATGLSAMAAMLSAGLFEYNFGDSEFLMMFLVLVTLPFAAARLGEPAHPRGDRAAAADRP
jgi:O-antigen ligase